MQQGQALALFALQRLIPLPARCGDTGGHRAGGRGPLPQVCCQAEPTLLAGSRAHPIPECGVGACRQSWPGAHLGSCQMSCQPAPATHRLLTGHQHGGDELCPASVLISWHFPCLAANVCNFHGFQLIKLCIPVGSLQTKAAELLPFAPGWGICGSACARCVWLRATFLHFNGRRIFKPPLQQHQPQSSAQLEI